MLQVEVVRYFRHGVRSRAFAASDLAQDVTRLRRWHKRKLHLNELIFVVSLVLLLPIAANAAGLNKRDCEFVNACFEGCAAQNYNCIRTGSEAHLAQEVMARHPALLEKKLLPLCEQVHSGALSKDAAYHRFCKTKPTWND